MFLPPLPVSTLTDSLVYVLESALPSSLLLDAGLYCYGRLLCVESFLRKGSMLFWGLASFKAEEDVCF